MGVRRCSVRRENADRYDFVFEKPDGTFGRLHLMREWFQGSWKLRLRETFWSVGVTQGEFVPPQAFGLWTWGLRRISMWCINTNGDIVWTNKFRWSLSD